MGQREHESLLTARAGAIDALREPLPLSVLLAFDGKAVPVAIIESETELVFPRGAGRQLCLHVLDAALEKRGEIGAFLWRPQLRRAAQLRTGGVEARWTVGLRLPDKTQSQPGAVGAFVQLLVHVGHIFLRALNAFLKLGRYFAEKVVFDDLALLVIKENAARGEFGGEAGVQLSHGAGFVLKRGGDDVNAFVGLLVGGAITVRLKLILQFLKLVAKRVQVAMPVHILDGCLALRRTAARRRAAQRR